MFSDLPVKVWMLQAFDLVHLFLSAEPFVVTFLFFFLKRLENIICTFISKACSVEMRESRNNIEQSVLDCFPQIVPL